jgi:hypothetical protein
MNDILDHIKSDIIRCYGSIEDPRCRFLEPNFEAQHDVRKDVCSRLQQAGFETSEQFTDFYYDRSVSFILNRDGIRCFMKLSLVGPYAWVFCGTAYNPGFHEEQLNSVEREVCSIARDHRFEVLSSGFLMQRIWFRGGYRMIDSILFNDPTGGDPDEEDS